MGLWPYHLTAMAAMLAAAAVACGFAAWLSVRARKHSRLKAASASIAAGIAVLVLGLAVLPYLVRALAA